MVHPSLLSGGKHIDRSIELAGKYAGNIIVVFPLLIFAIQRMTLHGFHSIA
jgi:hypothetical protein